MWLAIWQSAYSTELYRQVQHWRAKALLYLAVVLVLCWSPLLIKMQRTFNREIKRAEPAIVSQIPRIEFSQGVVKTPENRPYLIHLEGGAATIALIIDTSGRYTSLDGPDTVLLLTRDKCFLRQRAGEIRVYDLSKSPSSFVIDEALIHKLLRRLRHWCVPILSVFLILASFLKRLFQAFLLALAGLSVMSALGTTLEMRGLVSLAIVAMTPAMILETLWNYSGSMLPYTWILWGCLVVGYFLFALNAAAAPAEER